MSALIAETRAQLGRIATLLGIGLMLSLAQTPAAAQTQGSKSAGPEGGQWLARIQRAAAGTTYQGTLMFSAGGVVSSSKVMHICEGRQRYERVEVLDGRARLQYRHNDQLLTLWPDSKLAMVEQREAAAEFPALPIADSARTLDSYELLGVDKERVAGREADVLVFKPRDQHRFGQRLWVDHDTGLMLRNDVLGSAGEVLESSAFTDVQLGGRPTPDAVLRAMRKLDGYRVVRPQAERAQLEAEGWALARPVPGFQLLNCIKRPLEAVADGSASLQVLQSVFSDGLAHVSLFIEPYDARRHRQSISTSLGATHTLMNRHGNWWVTVVGEVPMVTVQLFDAMLERQR